eukprot:COSAG01_NODE_21388_length_904_cov_1.272050_1_plen_183_part_01
MISVGQWSAGCWLACAATHGDLCEGLGRVEGEGAPELRELDEGPQQAHAVARGGAAARALRPAHHLAGLGRRRSRQPTDSTAAPPPPPPPHSAQPPPSRARLENTRLGAPVRDRQDSPGRACRPASCVWLLLLLLVVVVQAQVGASATQRQRSLMCSSTFHTHTYTERELPNLEQVRACPLIA